MTDKIKRISKENEWAKDMIKMMRKCDALILNTPGVIPPHDKSVRHPYEVYCTICKKYFWEPVGEQGTKCPLCDVTESEKDN